MMNFSAPRKVNFKRVLSMRYLRGKIKIPKHKAICPVKQLTNITMIILRVIDEKIINSNSLQEVAMAIKRFASHSQRRKAFKPIKEWIPRY